MAFADIDLRDNGSNTFDINLAGGGGPTGNSNFFVFFDEPFLLFVILIGSIVVLG